MTQMQITGSDASTLDKAIKAIDSINPMNGIVTVSVDYAVSERLKAAHMLWEDEDGDLFEDFGLTEWRRNGGDALRLAQILNLDAKVELPADGATLAGVTGRTAEPGQGCGASQCYDAAVSTFMIDGEVFSHACERHIIEVHGWAEAISRAETYQRGSKVGRVNVTHVPVGARILVRRKMDTPLMLADTKTGALIATVLGKAKGGGFRCYTVKTDLGTFVAPAALAMWFLPSQ